MNDAYKQIRNYSKRLESYIDLERNKKSEKRNTRGLLARQNPVATKQELGEPDFNKRIANYISTIRQRRMGLKDVLGPGRIPHS
jgi:hypothetical protein